MRQPIWLRRPSGFRLTDLAARRLLFYHDFALAPQQASLQPVVGNEGSFSRATTRPYFDENGAYKETAPNELIFTQSPSGLLLPTIWPAATNLVTNNSSNGPSGGFQRVKLSGTVSWAGGLFNLGRYAADTNTGEHRVTLGTITSGISVGVYCASAIYKPTGGSSALARMSWEAVAGSNEATAAIIDLVSGAATLPPETSRWKPLKAGRIALPGGYYYIFFAAYLKSTSNVTAVNSQINLFNASGDYSFTGDGTTELALVGAHCLFGPTTPFIYPPAPIRTTGSTVTVAQDVLSFPFSTPFPSEGLTVHFEAEVSVLSSELPPSDGQNWHFYNLGTPDTAAGGTYSPFGATVSIIRGELQLDNTAATGSQPVSSSYWRESVQLTLSEETYWRNGVQYATRTQSRPAGMSPSPASIGISVARYAPIWLRRYALVKGIVNPKLLLT